MTCYFPTVSACNLDAPQCHVSSTSGKVLVLCSFLRHVKIIRSVKFHQAQFDRSTLQMHTSPCSFQCNNTCRAWWGMMALSERIYVRTRPRRSHVHEIKSAKCMEQEIQASSSQPVNKSDYTGEQRSCPSPLHLCLQSAIMFMYLNVAQFAVETFLLSSVNVLFCPATTTGRITLVWRHYKMPIMSTCLWCCIHTVRQVSPDILTFWNWEMDVFLSVVVHKCDFCQGDGQEWF